MIKEFKCFLSESQIFQNEPMKKHTTFKTGGSADLLVAPENAEQIKKCVEICKDKSYPYYVMGNGSNLLVSDKGFRGVVIKISKSFSAVSVEGEAIAAQAGASLSRISSEALKNSLKGFEFASGIPGTVGGAVCMNAGAYGSEMKDVVSKITVLKDNEIKYLSNEEAGFEYRSSNIFKENMIVLEVKIDLKKGNPNEIKALIDDLKRKRCEKQPLDMPSAGSTFKRPLNAFAGKLIMDCGLSGFCVGDAQVSPKHCGFVVNKGCASTEDILNLIKIIKEKVYDKYNIMLEEEVKIIGEL